MKQSEFKHWLQKRGARFENGKRHIKIYLNGKQSTMPRHPGHEIGEGFRRAVLRRLGIEDKES
jgi:mRNA interferase HicA